MNRSDQHWQQLLSLAAPTFKGEPQAPYGFSTNLLAQLRSKENQSLLFERIGLRAFMTSLATFGVILVLAITINYSRQPDVDPGIRSLISIQNLQWL